ncbi:aldo/keto reductase [Arthrobacter sp. NPDC090010]|uniref:aldo/keto reductase n=1 Tax=Arthrobacter sp. NPDC090010 TaxID=3363942 RepID=UPI0037FE852B
MSMTFRRLGRTGIHVSRFGLGTMHLGAWGNTDTDDATALVHRALDAGINLVDTADMYSDGESELIVGKAIKDRRDDVVLASKGFFPMGSDVNRRGSSRRWITQAVDASLKRLDTDRIDLYQVHRPDPTVDLDETLGVLSDLVRAGKVISIGSSGYSAERQMEAHWVADRRGHIPFHTEQSPYSIFVRGVERHVLPTAQRLDMGVLTWSPLNSGWLTGRFRGGSEMRLEGFREMISYKFDLSKGGNQRKLHAVEQLLRLSAESGIPLTHLALSFAASHPAVSSVLLGPRTTAQLDDLLAASSVRLSNDVLDRIDEIVPPATDLNPEDVDYTPPHLQDPSLRRRSD